jgi:hypothetical protein
MLPAEFADLEPHLAERCVESEADRFALRFEAPTAEIRAFYDAIAALAEEAIATTDTPSMGSSRPLSICCTCSIRL